MSSQMYFGNTMKFLFFFSMNYLVNCLYFHIDFTCAMKQTLDWYSRTLRRKTSMLSALKCHSILPQKVCGHWLHFSVSLHVHGWSSPCPLQLCINTLWITDVTTQPAACPSPPSSGQRKYLNILGLNIYSQFLLNISNRLFTIFPIFSLNKLSWDAIKIWEWWWNY